MLKRNAILGKKKVTKKLDKSKYRWYNDFELKVAKPVEMRGRKALESKAEKR